MDRRTFMKLLGGLASMPIVGRLAKPLKSETVQEGVAAVSDKGMQLYEMVVAKVTKVKKGSKIIDDSVRQVSGHRKKEKIREWKNEHRASKLLELVANNLKIDYEKLLKEIRNNHVNDNVINHINN